MTWPSLSSQQIPTSLVPAVAFIENILRDSSNCMIGSDDDIGTQKFDKNVLHVTLRG